MVYLAFEVTQNDFNSILLCFFISFLAFAKMLHSSWKQLGVLKAFIILAVLIRVILMFSFPQLSDDIYRFLWDGHLINVGVSPINETPSALFNNGMVDDYLKSLYTLLNSPEYFTVYPPFSQFIYYLASLFGGLDIQAAVLVLKFILLCFEIGTIALLIKLLTQFNLPRKYVLLYALNPLVIIEIMGNAHFEGVMVFFLLLALFFLQSKGYFASALAFSFSVLTKLLPLMFLPALIIKLKGKDGHHLKYLLWSGLFIVILSSPYLLDLDITHFLSSINLYFQKFEFNASVYYLLRQLFLLLTGYNQIFIIGPALGLITLVFILRMAYKMPGGDLKSLIEVCFLSFCVYLFLATTVHPWYLILPLCLSVFRPRLWILVWSFTIVFSYGHYDTTCFLSPGVLIALEYIVIGLVWFSEKKYPLLKTEAGIAL